MKIQNKQNNDKDLYFSILFEPHALFPPLVYEITTIKLPFTALHDLLIWLGAKCGHLKNYPRNHGTNVIKVYHTEKSKQMIYESGWCHRQRGVLTVTSGQLTFALGTRPRTTHQHCGEGLASERA